MKRWKLPPIVLLLLFAVDVAAQCGPNGCPVPGVSSGASQSYQAPPQYAVRVKVQYGRQASGGSGTLVYRGEKYGGVLTCAHIFERQSGGEIKVVFAGGSKPGYGPAYPGKLAAIDRARDLAVITIPRPQFSPARIATEAPSQGDTVYSAGFGPDGRFRVNRGSIVAYGTRPGGKSSLKLTGPSRSGDSGGPVFNATGELVGVLWGTDGRYTQAVPNGEIHAFTELTAGRYLFPWNADVATERERTAQAQAAQQVAPPLPVPIAPSTDPALVGRVERLETQVAGLNVVAEAARTAAANAETEAGKMFAELAGVKTQAVGASLSAAAASTDAQTALGQAGEVAEQVAKVEGSLFDRVKTFVAGKLTALGWGGGAITAVLGLLIFFVRKDVLDKIRTGDPLLIEKLADRTRNTVDDRVADVVAGALTRVAERFHGPAVQPVPPQPAATASAAPPMAPGA